MRTLPIVRDDFVNKDLCGPCGGICCKTYPGAAFPDDFGAPDPIEMQNRLLDAFLTGRWSMDCWDGYFGAVLEPKYVRPSVASQEGNPFDRTYGGRCTFLTTFNRGCEIFETRPIGCRGLKPESSGVENGSPKCRAEYGSKRDSIESWIPYQQILDDLLDLFGS